MHLARRAPAREVDGLRVGEVDLCLLDVTRNVDEDGAAAAGAGDVEGRLHRGADLLHVHHEPRVLDDRHRDAGDVALLEGVGADQGRAHLPRDADERRRVHPGVGDRGDEVRGAGTGGRDGDPDPAGGARVALRHVAGALLVAGENVADGGAAGHRVVGRHDRAARDPEHHVDAFGLERAEDRVCSVHSHSLSFGLTVPRPFPGRLDGDRCCLRRRVHWLPTGARSTSP